MKPTISFLIPAYNDGQTIERAIKEAREVGEKEASEFEIIVIDDGSSDDAGKILKILEKKYKELRVVTHSENQGYGKTIKELYYAGQYEWLFTIPGDYQVGPRELLKLLPYIDQADMIIGWRKNRHDPASRLVQTAFYNWLLRLLFGVSLHDINSIRLMKRSLFNKVKLTSGSAFVDAELAIKAKRAGFTIVEVPIGHRASVKKGSGGKWWTIVPTIVEMARFWFRNSSLDQLEDRRASRKLQEAIKNGGEFVGFTSFDKKRRKDLKR